MPVLQEAEAYNKLSDFAGDNMMNRAEETPTVLGLLPDLLLSTMQLQLDALPLVKREGILLLSDNTESNQSRWISSISADDLPRIILLQGYRNIFSSDFKRNYRDLYSSSMAENSRDFAYLNFRDPLGNYSVLGINPLVFAVDNAGLKEQRCAIPRSWADLIDSSFSGKIDLSGLDMSSLESIYLHVHKIYGIDKAVSVAASFKSNRECPISILPYSLARNRVKKSSVSIVWPSDGAVIVPIFLLVKSQLPQELDFIHNWLTSASLGASLSSSFFPSMHPAVDSRLPSNVLLSWLGWDYLLSTDPDQTLASIKSSIGD